MSDKDSKDEPRIIVDDDWKSRVAEEKEQLKKQRNAEASDAADPQMPPASFAMLITTLATQAMVALGQLPDPIDGRPAVRRPVAKHFIDTLALLQEKSAGNLTADEAAMLEDALHQLRMAYVHIGGQSETPQRKPDSTIELP